MDRLQVDPELIVVDGMVLIARSHYDDSGHIIDFKVVGQYDLYGNPVDQSNRSPYLFERVYPELRQQYEKIVFDVVKTGVSYYSQRMMCTKFEDGIIISWRTATNKEATIESRLDAALRISNIGMAVHDINDHIVDWSSGAIAILGFDKGEVLGYFDVGGVIDENAKFLGADIIAGVKNGESFLSLEVHKTHKNGTDKILSVSVTPISDVNGEVNGYLSVFYDITSIVDSEKKSLNLDSIEPITNAGILFLDDNQRILSWNKGAELILGYTPQEVIGKKEDVYSFPELFDRQDLYIESLLKNGETGGMDDVIKRHKNGEPIVCSFTTSPVVGKDGKHFGSVIVFNDVTDKYEAQKRINMFMNVIDQTQVGIVIRDRNGIVTEINESASRIFGYHPNEVVGKRFEFSGGNQEEMKLSDDVQVKTSNGQKVTYVERNFVRKDGTKIVCGCSYSPFFDENNNLINLVSIIQDITEAKEKDKRTEHAESMVKTLFENMEIGVALYKLTPDEKDLEMIMHNVSYKKLIGYDMNVDLVGKRFTTYTKGDSRYVYDLINVAKSGKGKNLDIYSNLAKRQMSISLFSPFESHVALFYADRSEVADAKEAVERHRNDLNVLFSSLNTGLSMGHVIRNDEGEIVDIVFDLVNQTYERYDGLTNFISGKTFSEVYASQEMNYYNTLVDVASNGTHKVIYRDISSLNRILEVSCYSTHQDSFVTIVNDLTDRIEMENRTKKAYQDARDASEMKSTFIATMSHEIRTPLNGVIGFAELGVEEDNPIKAKEYFEKIKISADSLLSIITGILDISKIESGKMEIESVPFIMSDLLETCKIINGHKAEEKNITFLVESDIPEDVVLLGDVTKLKQILLNLLSNAIKFTEWGVIKISALGKMIDNSSIRIHFEVKDNGIGMSEEQIKRVFDPFVQADSSTTRKYGGTGLGLPISKKLIEMLGGELELVSRLDFGSIFSFDIDFKIGENIEKSAAFSASNLLKFNAKVLVCEDNELNQEVIKEILYKFGINPVIVDNGRAAVDYIENGFGKDNVDLIFMDIHMPIMDGIEATSLIRELGCQTPIIALTANVLAADIAVYLKAGMNDHVAKPFNRQQLVDCLLKYLIPIN